MVDGFVIYPIVADLEKNIRIAHCWAHADRKFKDAKDPPQAIREIRRLIARLYEIEREIDGPFPGAAGDLQVTVLAEELGKVLGRGGRQVDGAGAPRRRCRRRRHRHRRRTRGRRTGCQRPAAQEASVVKA